MKKEKSSCPIPRTMLDSAPISFFSIRVRLGVGGASSLSQSWHGGILVSGRLCRPLGSQ